MPTAERLRRKLDVKHWHQVLAVAFLSPKVRAGTLGSYRKRLSALSQGAEVPELQVDDAERELIDWYLATDEVFDGVETPAEAPDPGKPYRIGSARAAGQQGRDGAGDHSGAARGRVPARALAAEDRL